MFPGIDVVNHKLNRRGFMQTSALAAGSLLLSPAWLQAAEHKTNSSLSVADLPKGSAPMVAVPA
jgi:hypothetical protein